MCGISPKGNQSPIFGSNFERQHESLVQTERVTNFFKSKFIKENEFISIIKNMRTFFVKIEKSQ